MENASKALIIAGAILLAILIISLGIMVYNNAKNTVGSASLNEQEISTFNSKWETYIGSNKTASEVSTMFSAVIANNASEKTAGTNRYVGVINSATASIGTITASTTITVSGATVPAQVPTISNSTTYTMTAHYADSGLIDYITIT